LTAATSATSVGQLYRWSLPIGTQLLGGADGLARAVTWAVTLRYQASLRRLGGGEVVLIPRAVFRRLQASLSFGGLLQRLAGANIAAVVVQGEPAAGAGTLADRLRIPLLRLPEGQKPDLLEWELNQRLIEWQSGSPISAADRPGPEPGRRDNDPVHLLLTGSYGEQRRALTWARERGFEVEQTLVVCAVAMTAPSPEGLACHLEGRVLWCWERDALALVLPAPVADFAALKTTAGHWAETLAGLGEGRISVGIGCACASPADLGRSWLEAVQALALGRRRFGEGAITCFGELGIWRFLLESQEREELRRFHDDMLGALVAYDRRHNGELVSTLEAYFASGRSLVGAAALLRTHRNTITYRLDRIQAVIGARLDHPETDVALHLALLAGKVLAAGAGPLAPPEVRFGAAPALDSA
jgi:hypothetical protein